MNVKSESHILAAEMAADNGQAGECLDHILSACHEAMMARPGMALQQELHEITSRLEKLPQRLARAVDLKVNGLRQEVRALQAQLDSIAKEAT